ncbi:MAG: response regulator transcription factor [Clostridium sp.]|uniref:response regulator transcription factor n=1 Tax=Clostridium sp. TaxID=1506 RepID=UPI00303E7867
MNYKILVIDDEKNIVRLLKDFFEIQGFSVYTAYNGVQALEKAALDLDIILLDINMPEMDGIEVCKRIRDFVSCPILFLTAKIEEQDRVKGLMVGGDDYILKPFSIEELDARVKAHLRREERKVSKDRVRFLKELVISYSERKIFYEGKEISLTKTEFDIVEMLSMNKGQIFTKEKIYENLWGFDKDGDSSIITEHIRRVRVKLAKCTNNTLIETIWGVGYKWIG